MTATTAGRVSLRRDEAEARAAQLTVSRIAVELDLRDPAAEVFASRTTLEFASTGSESWLDFRARRLVSATVNGVACDPGAWRDDRLALHGLGAHNVVVVEGLMPFTSDGEGLHRHVDPEDGETYLYAMSFLDAAPLWFACFDQPDLKSSYSFDVRAPVEWTVIGNGPSRQLAPGHWRIDPPAPLAPYVVTLVAGLYASVHTEHDGIRLGFHTRASLREHLEAQSDDLIEVTAEAFDYYHATFGIRYPFGEYHQAFVPDFNAGAMENPGCVTLRDSLIFRGRATATERGRRAGVVAHEMAHMWFGDLVTMRWWDDLWLNESFAEYLAHRCCTDATDYPLWTEFGIVRKDWGSVVDQSPSTHPVAGNGADDAEAALQAFDGISYAKGAAVLKQLASHLGDDVFLNGLRRYFTRFRFGNARFADLIDAWVEAGAVDLHRWADAWLQTTGMDTLDITAGPAYALTRSGPVPRPHAVRVGAVDASGRITLLAPTRLEDEPVPLSVAGEPALLLPDATDATWAKVRFGEHGWSRLAAVLPGLADRTALVVVYNAVRDAVRNAELAPAEALELVTTGLPSAESDLIVNAMLHFAADQLAGAYCPVAERPAALARVHRLARTIMTSSGAGSDRQLTAFRLCVRACEDATLLAHWAAGERLPAGLSLDPELGWRIVHRLASLGADPDCIDQALIRDASAAGVVHAARARAAVPTPEAKEWAWRFVVGPSSASAYELYAICEGFFDPAQHDLTTPYAARYFSDIPATSRFRSGWALGEVAAKAYPWPVATPQVLTRAERALADDLPGPVRRAVVDGTDRLRRAVASLERFAG